MWYTRAHTHPVISAIFSFLAKPAPPPLLLVVPPPVKLKGLGWALGSPYRCLYLQQWGCWAPIGFQCWDQNELTTPIRERDIFIIASWTTCCSLIQPTAYVNRQDFFSSFVLEHKLYLLCILKFLDIYLSPKPFCNHCFDILLFINFYSLFPSSHCLSCVFNSSAFVVVQAFNS